MKIQLSCSHLGLMWFSFVNEFFVCLCIITCEQKRFISFFLTSFPSAACYSLPQRSEGSEPGILHKNLTYILRGIAPMKAVRVFNT